MLFHLKQVTLSIYTGLELVLPTIYIAVTRFHHENWAHSVCDTLLCTMHPIRNLKESKGIMQGDLEVSLIFQPQVKDRSGCDETRSLQQGIYGFTHPYAGSFLKILSVGSWF